MTLAPNTAPRRFDSVLIANRGEIARRVMRTARRMGYRVVAVYSDADAQALHVREADAAVRIGPPPARESYLHIAALIDAARRSGAQAIHPGYGFLAENADFAQAVHEAGLSWIGPGAEAIRAMGDKARAKRLMAVAGVPCIPGYDGEAQDDATLHAQAQHIGFPLMIKATAGGGGRGMRRVESIDAFGAALVSARSEALAAFGADTVLLERAIRAPRHVEIQVFADEHGHVVHLGERDCSVQRRHQKILEEAPSPALHGTAGRELRRRMGAMAVDAARAIHYRGAGTIECLLDADGSSFYFMEMNTRLQVEHPVTEALTGYDLVEWQLRVAQGEVLPEHRQDEILRRFESGGHAIEARLCAEDPAQGFLPQSGRVVAWRIDPSFAGPPRERLQLLGESGEARVGAHVPSLRVEYALESGSEISPFYDSMVAKFVAHAGERAGAIQALVQALHHSVLLGPASNQGFLVDCLLHPEFMAGAATTQFIPQHGAELLARRSSLPPALAALALLATRSHALGHDPAHVALPLAWAVPVRFTLDGQPHALHVQAEGGDSYHVATGEGPQSWRLLALDDHQLRAESPGGRIGIAWARDGERLLLGVGGHQHVVEDFSLRAAASAAGASAGVIRAPMAGRVIALHVHEGQQVTKGAPLVVLEAMKMEHPALAPADARVRRVNVLAGAQVAAGSLLVELEIAPQASPMKAS